MLFIIDPTTNHAFPHTLVDGRLCFAVPFHARFAVRVDPVQPECEAVISVDGRDVLTNQPASPNLPGVIIRSTYASAGFQVSNSEAASFVHMPKGAGLLTAERNGTVDACGLVGVTLFAREGRASQPVQRQRLESFVEPAGGHMRGVSRSGSSGGAMAGASVSAPLGETHWTRGVKVGSAVIEYDTREGWLARGVVIAALNQASPWPGQAPQFAARAGL